MLPQAEKIRVIRFPADCADFSQICAEGVRPGFSLRPGDAGEMLPQAEKIRVIRIIRVPKNPQHPK
jgi:hypothetical protein